MKRIYYVFCLLTFLSTFVYEEVKFENYYPRILTLDNDSYNEILFLNYQNFSGEELYIRIYDIYGILVDEEKVSGSQAETSTGQVYVYKYKIQNKKDKFVPGVYIFVVATKEKPVSKGTFVVVK